MLVSVTAIFATLSLLPAAILANPIVKIPESNDIQSIWTRAVSFNHYDDIATMDNFDGFFGNGNFDGSSNKQVVIQEKEVVCHSEEVEIIQQKLVILQEVAKRIITEQICEVEVQTIVLEQFSSRFESFMDDITRSSGKQVGYDSNVAGMFGKIVNSNGSLSTSNLGLSGQSVGSHVIVPQGSNWNSKSSPAKVQSAKQAAVAAAAQ